MIGSATLDELVEREGTIAFETQLRKPAIRKILLKGPVSNALFVMDDFVGEVVGGTQSFTFEGDSLNGLYRMSYRCEHANRGGDVADY
ncbi:MAG: hypothetical protein ABSD12_28405 [Paraburkholderia sp.]